MATPMGPKEAAQRAMREQRFAESQKRPTAKPVAKAVKIAKAKALANMSNAAPLSNTQSNKPASEFDKAAYQREYMRKRRAAAKAT